MPQSDDNERQEVSPDEARQGQVVLRESWQRWLFLGGLVAAAIVSIALGIWAS